MNEFQERLQDLIEENGLNRLQLANRLGVSSTTINGYFNNDYYPQIDIAIKMTSLFNCSLDYLFASSDKKKSSYKIDANNLTANLIDNLDLLLKENKISIAKAMKELQMSEYNYYRWKSGKFPKTINLLSVAKFFEISIDELLGKANNK